MAITRSFQWYRTNSSSPTDNPVAITGPDTIKNGVTYGPTREQYISQDADVSKFIHMKETATNGAGSSLPATSNSVGPIAEAGEVYTPAAGRIAPIEATVTGTPLVPRVIRRSEQDTYDAEVVSMAALHSLMHTTQSRPVVQSGNWSDPATWGGALNMPKDGDAIQIGSAFTVIYDVESSVKIKYINCHGQLKWNVAVDTKLIVDTIHSSPASYIQIGTKDNPATFSATNGKPRVKIEFIGDAPGSQANNPGVTASGHNITLGMMTMGKVDIHGEEIVEKVDINSVNAANASTITAKAGQDISKWRVGDWVVVLSRNYSGFGPDPEYAGPYNYYVIPSYRNGNYNYTGGVNNFKKSQDELRQITAIDYATRVITLDQPLNYSHPELTTTRNLPVAPHALSADYGFVQGQPVTIPARVMNMSRSIEFESTGNLRKADGKINTQTRAHIMFMASDQVDVRWFGCKNMARTNTDCTLTVSEPGPYKHPASSRILYGDNRLYADDACTQDLADPNNVRGRYAVHFHGPGPLGDGARFNRNLMRCIGASCWATRGAPPQPGWVITHHNSNVAMEHCTIAFFRGGGMVSEAGSEIGQWLHNTVAGGLSDSFAPFWGGRQRNTPNHNGHAGVAYDNQARQILQRDNEATGCRIGWLYEIQEDCEIGVVKGANPQSLRLTNPLVGGTAMFNDRDTYGLAQPQITDLHGCIGVDLDVMFRANHRVNIQRQDNTPFIALGWRCAHVNHIMNVENYSYNYFFRDFAYFAGTNGDVSFQGTRSAQFGWRNGIIEGFAKFAADGRINHGPGWIDIATNMTQPPEDGSGPIKSSGSMPNVTPTFTMKSPADPDMAFNLYGDNPTWGGQPKPLFRGTFADGFSPSGRPWPFWQEDSASTPESGGGFNTMSTTEGSHAYELIERNGVYQVGGQWKMPGWFGTVDWKTFDAVFFKVDFNLVGTWDQDFLTRNTIVPTAPTWPLLPEDVNKPFPVLSPPSNLVAPFIGGLCHEGGRLECVPGVWTSKPNDVSWFDYNWLRNGTTSVGHGRIYVPVAADAGQSITCQVTALNDGGKSAVLTTAAVTPRAAYTGPTPQQIFGSAFKDWWDIEDPDTPFDAYAVGAAFKPGCQMASQNQMIGWAGNNTLTNFGTVGSTFTIVQNGWGAEKSRCATTAPVKGKSKGRLWTNIGSGNNPMHLWVVVQRPNINQTQYQGPVVMAAGHATWVSDNDSAQNVIGNSAAGQTLSNFPKGGRGVIYHGRDTNGMSWGFNNTRFTTNNGGISDGNREVNLGYNGSMIDYKAMYWVEANGITAQQHADMQAYLTWKHGLA